MIYVVCDEVDKKVWMLFEAASDRAAKRIMRQKIIEYQKDVDFDFTLRTFEELPDYDVLPVVCNSDVLFKSDEDLKEFDS